MPPADTDRDSRDVRAIQKIWHVHRNYEFGYLQPERRRIIEGYLANTVVHPEATILNLMCGQHAYISRSEVRNQIGVDITSDTLKRNPDIDQELSRAMNLDDPEVVLPFPNEMFTSAVMISGIRYLNYPCSLLKETMRTLMPGGEFVIGFDESDVGAEADSVYWRDIERSAGTWKGGTLEDFSNYMSPFFERIGQWLHQAGFTPTRQNCFMSTTFQKPYLFVAARKN